MPRFNKDRTSIIMNLGCEFHYTTCNQPFITLSPSHSFNSQVIRISSSFPSGLSIHMYNQLMKKLDKSSDEHLQQVVQSNAKSILLIVCWALIMILPRTRSAA